MTLALTVTCSESEIFVVLISEELKIKNNFSFRKTYMRFCCDLIVSWESINSNECLCNLQKLGINIGL